MGRTIALLISIMALFSLRTYGQPSIDRCDKGLPFLRGIPLLKPAALTWLRPKFLRPALENTFPASAARESAKKEAEIQRINRDSFDPKKNPLLLDYSILTPKEIMMGGRDRGSLSDLSEFGYQTKPDHAYRVVDRAAIDQLKRLGYVDGEDAQVIANHGVDYYSGKASLKYGKPRPGSPYSVVDENRTPRNNPLAARNGLYVLEVPIDRNRFLNLGNLMSGEADVHHLKGYGKTRPHTIEEVKVIRIDGPQVEFVDMRTYKTGPEEAKDSNR